MALVVRCQPIAIEAPWPRRIAEDLAVGELGKPKDAVATAYNKLNDQLRALCPPGPVYRGRAKHRGKVLAPLRRQLPDGLAPGA